MRHVCRMQRSEVCSSLGALAVREPIDSHAERRSERRGRLQTDAPRNPTALDLRRVPGGKPRETVESHRAKALLQSDCFQAVGKRHGQTFSAHQKFSQAEREAGLSHSHVGAMVNERSVPTLENVAKVAAVLGVTIDWLVTGRGAKRRALGNERTFDELVAAVAERIGERPEPPPDPGPNDPPSTPPPRPLGRRMRAL